MLRCYPDYGKAPAEYVANLMAVLERYPVEIVQRLVDPLTGIPSQCRFLPTIADIVAMADPLVQAMQAREEGQVKGAYYSSLRPMSMAEYASRQDDPEDLAIRKATVVRELGYDPDGFRRGKAWCFDPEKPPPNAPWRDPEKLRESAERIAREASNAGN